MHRFNALLVGNHATVRCPIRILLRLIAWTAAAIIKTIECGDLVLNAPFQGVVSIQRLWKFSVEPNNIVSVGPNSKKP